MQVDVVGDARARHAAEVPAEVEAIRRVDGGKRVDGGDGESVQLDRFVVRELAERADVARGRRQQVAGRVRVLVQERDRRRSPRCTTSDSPSASSPTASAQKTQPLISSACTTYSSRHGAHSCLVMSGF